MAKNPYSSIHFFKFVLAMQIRWWWQHFLCVVARSGLKNEKKCKLEMPQCFKGQHFKRFFEIVSNGAALERPVEGRKFSKNIDSF